MKREYPPDWPEGWPLEPENPNAGCIHDADRPHLIGVNKFGRIVDPADPDAIPMFLIGNVITDGYCAWADFDASFIAGIDPDIRPFLASLSASIYKVIREYQRDLGLD